MKFFLDFFPLVIFVGIYMFSGEAQPMYPAVVGLMVATVIQNIGTRLITGKFEKLHVWTLIVTLIFGGMTLAFRDPAFIFWKASVLVWLTAVIFLFRQFYFKKILLQEMLSKALEGEIEVPNQLWSKLNIIWSIFYILFGFLNLYIAYNFSEAFWVKFKLFGLMGLNVLLLVYIMFKLVPYFPDENEDSGEMNNSKDSNEES